MRRFRHISSLGIEPLQRREMLSGIPVLNSLPGSEHTAYLDFDGEVLSNTGWNNVFDTIHATAFDMDGDPTTVSDAEAQRITQIWEQVAEDFRPFNINITTVDPSIDNPGIFAEPETAQRILFTSRFDSGPGGTGEQWFDEDGFDGVASYGSWMRDIDNPVLVFATHANAGSVGSHELGHAFDLDHDGEVRGLDIIDYRQAHGSGETRWSPIMGIPRGLSQWSRGGYTNASNTEDDVAYLGFYLGYQADDFTGLTELPLNGDSVFVEGNIHSSADTDTFTIEINEPGTVVSINAEPWHESPNLDIGLSLFGPFSYQFTTDNPTVNPPERLASSFEITLDPGTYYLTVDGVGKAAVPGDEGYSDYGSLGYYKLTGSVGSSTPELRGDVNSDGQLDASDIDAVYAVIGLSAAADTGGDGVAVRADLDADGTVTQTDVDLLVRDVMGTEYGDFDLNGRVEFADFLALAADFGKQNVGWAGGDADGDGEVAFADFLMLAAAFGFESDTND